MTSPKLTIEISPIKYILRNAEEHDMVAKLLPKDKEEVKLMMTGKLSASFMNSIRRCLISEIPINELYAKREDITTDEDFPDDWLESRIACIPIKQDYNHLECKFHLKNDDATERIITTSDMDFKDSGDIVKPCDQFQVLFLSAHKTATINSITTIKRYGYLDGVVTAAVMKYYDSDDNSATMIVQTNNTFDAKSLIPIVCDELILRFGRLIEFLEDDSDTSDFYILKISSELNHLTVFGESHTMANILVECIYELDPSITYLNYKLTHESERNFILQWRHPDKKIVLNGAKLAVSIYQSFK